MPCRVGSKSRLCGSLLFLVSVAAAQEVPTDHCVPDLTGLKYPTAALEQRIQGFVSIGFTVDSDGKVADIESTAYPLLKAGVEEALLSARLLPECSGQHISMQVNFRLDQDIQPQSPISVKRFSDTAYEVVSPVQWITTTIYDPAYTFTRRGRFLHRVKRWFKKLRFW